MRKILRFSIRINDKECVRKESFRGLSNAHQNICLHTYNKRDNILFSRREKPMNLQMYTASALTEDFVENCCTLQIVHASCIWFR